MEEVSFQKSAVRTISVEDWLSLSESDVTVPVQVTLSGVSMEPLIRKGKDVVTFLPVSRPLKKGDVVIFKRQDGAYVCHRVFRIGNGIVQTMGDNCVNLDFPVSTGNVYALAARVQRGNKIINLDTGLARFMGLCRLLYRRFRAYAVKLLYPAYKRIKSVVKGNNG